jgi:hypothetical protein
MPQYSLFIDGRRTEAAAGRRYDSVDPYLGQPWVGGKRRLVTMTQEQRRESATRAANARWTKAKQNP